MSSKESRQPENREFRERILRWWGSSHPAHQERRFRVLHRWAWVPLILLVFFLILRFTDVEGIPRLFRKIPWWIVGMACAVAFAVCWQMTSAILLRISILRQHGMRLRLLDSDTWVPNTNALYLGLGLLFGVLVPLLLFEYGHILSKPFSDSPSWNPFRFIAGYLALLPLFLLLLALQLGEKHYLGKQVRYRAGFWSFFWGLLKWVSIALLIVTLAYDLIELLVRKGVADENPWQWIGRSHQWLISQLPWYPNLGKSLAGLAYLLPAVFLLYTLQKIFRTPEYLSPVEEEEEDDPSAKKQPWWKRLLLGFFSFGRKRKKTGDGGEADPLESEDPFVRAQTPGWVRAVVEGLQLNLESVERSRVEDSAPTFETPPAMSWLFGRDIMPSVDQDHALRAFIGKANRSYLPATEESGGEPTSIDLLVHGRTGAGKTTTLMAMALYALLSRGQRCVVLVPTVSRAHSWCERFRKLLSKIGYREFATLCNLGEPDQDNSLLRDEWVEGSKPFPDILVGTVEQFHTCFYNQSNQDKENIRQVITLLEVVFVEDFFEHRPLIQQHLPFILDKHRLILEAFSSQLQTVVSTRPLGDFAISHTAPRLFPGMEDAKPHSCEIRPRPNENGWRVLISADEPRETLMDVAVFCLDQNRQILVFQKDGDQRKLQSLKAEIARKSTNPDPAAAIKVLGDFDHISIENGDTSSVILTISQFDDGIGFSLQAWGDRDECVVFQIMPRHNLRIPEDSENICPILPARDARGFLIEHLSGALAFIPRRWPVPFDAWRRLGFLPNDDADTHERVKHVLAEFEIDQAAERSRFPHSFVLLNEFHARRNERLGPLSVSRYPSRAGRIAPVPNTDDRIRLEIYYDTDRLKLGTAEVRWTSRAQNRQELDRSDLRHLVTLRFDRGDGFLVPGFFRYDENDDCYEIECTFAEGAGYDAIYPKWDLEWTGLPRATDIRTGGGGRQPIRFFTVGLSDLGIARCRITQRFDEFGSIIDLSPALEYAYRARITGILLGSSESREDPRQIAQDLLDGAWKTTDEPLRRARYLALAFERTLRQLFPGYENYGKCVAEYLEGHRQKHGHAVIWIVETDTSGTSVSSTVLNVLGREKWRKVFFAKVVETLDLFAKQEDRDRRDRMARVLAKSDLGTTEGTGDDLQAAIEAVEMATGEKPVPVLVDPDEDTGETTPVVPDPPPSDLVPVDSHATFRYWLVDPAKGKKNQEDWRVGVHVPESDVEKMRLSLLPSKGRHYHRANFRGVEDLFSLDGPLLRGAGRDAVTRFVGQIASRTTRAKWDRVELANRLLHFVQREIRYKLDIESTGFEEYGRFPLQTLVDGHGDCECKAILTLGLLLYLGYDCALISFDFEHEKTGHVDPALRIDPFAIEKWGIKSKDDLYVKNQKYYLYGSAAPDGRESSPWGKKITHFNGDLISRTEILPLSADGWRMFELFPEPEPEPVEASDG